MKKLICKVVVYLSPIVVLLLCIELFYQIVPNNYSFKNENVKKRYSDTKILILGNSHTFYGLNPKYFDKPAFNLSNISQTLYFDQLLLEKHFDRFKNLEFIVLNVEFTSLSQLDNTQDDVWRKYYYKRYMDLQVPIVTGINPKNYFLSSTRSFDSNLKLIKRYFSDGTIVDCDNNGFGINYTKEKRKSDLYRMTPITVKQHEDNLFDFTDNTDRIQSIINKCKNKGIQVLLVTMPVSKSYAKSVNQHKLDKIFKTCLFLEKNNKNVYYLNLFKDYHFTDDDFFDPDHLHIEGAKKCSLLVNKFIK